MKKIALTGTMGSGKSYVAKIIESYGIFVMDADELAKDARRLYQQELFVLFHVSDEHELASIVFEDDEQRQKLEDLLYPWMIEAMQTSFKAHQDDKIVVVEVPLLFEKHWDSYFDEIWCVVAKDALCIQRLMENRNYTKAEVLARMSKQMPIEEKQARSDVLIYNNETDDVALQVRALLAKEGAA